MTATTHAFVLKPIAAEVRRRAGLTLGYGALATLPGLALAGPAGEQLVGGAATVARPDASQTVVTQTSQQAVMNWQSFSVAGNEYVKFVQPGTNAAILNRVVGPDMSSIFGRLEANGRVFLVNPRGVYFAPGAQVDVGALAASVLDIRDDDFMNGRYVFAKSANGADGAAVVNEGRISTNGAGGFVALLGERVENTGMISARLGTVALAAGSKVTLDINNDGLVNLAVDEQAVSALSGVKNAGQIVADGGRVVMSAKVADGLAATAVNNAGLVRAHSIVEQGGEIVLAASGGNAVNTGTIDVSGEQGQGGGKAVVYSDKDVELATQSAITANGDGAGAGGKVRVIADGHLDFAKDSTVSAVGGAAGGTGGMVELSGHTALALKGNLELGQGGQLLIDPARLQIGSGSAASYGGASITSIGKAFIENNLKSGTNVSLIATQEIFASGPMAIDATAGPGAGNLKLGIGNYSGSCGNGWCFGSPVFTPTSTGSIHLSGVNIAIKGQFTAQAGTATGDIQIGHVTASRISMTANGGDIATGNLTVNGTNTADISLTGNTIHTGALSAVATAANGSASIDLSAQAGVTINGNVTATGDSASITIHNNATGGVLINGNVLATANQWSAYVDIGNYSGAQGVRINGNVSAVATGTSEGSAETYVHNSGGGPLNIQGSVIAQGGGSGAWVDLENWNGGGITVSGSLLATATGRRSRASASNEGPGAILIGGNVTVSNPDGSGSIDLSNSGGAVTVNGSMSAAGRWDQKVRINASGAIAIAGAVTATATSSHASLELHGSQVAVQGPITVHGSGSGYFGGSSYGGSSYQGATVDIHALNGVQLGGAVLASGPGFAGIRVRNTDTGAIVIGGQMAATGGSAGYVEIENGGAGGIQTVGNGIIAANTGVLLGDSGGGPLSVKTQTPMIILSAGSGSAAPAVAVDNRSYTGPAGLYLSPSLGSGPNLRGSGSGLVKLGETKFGFGGNAVISGDFSVRNIYVEVNNGALAIAGSLLVGDTPLDSSLGDALTIKALQLAVRPDGRHLSLPEYQGVIGVGPNAVFRAQYGIMIGGSPGSPPMPGMPAYSALSFDDPDTPYVVFQSDGPVITGPVASVNPTAKSFIAQYAAYTPTNPITVEDQPASTTGAGFFNVTNFKTLPGTTILIGGLSLPGGKQTGKITIGTNGGVNIGDQNILFATTGGVTGLGNVKSTGFVADLDLLLAPVSEVFQAPVVTEFSDANEAKDEEERRNQALDTGEEGASGEGGLITQQSNTGQLCQ